MILRFLYASESNAFLRELLGALGAAVRAEGAEAFQVEGEGGRAGADTIDVVVPHEYWALAPGARWPGMERRRRTIAIITEHPGTHWFEMATLMASGLGASFALNRGAVAAGRARGLRLEHLQLGYVPGWDAWHGQATERPIDITYMGVSEGRRNRVLAGFSHELWRWRTSLLVPALEPSPEGRADFLTGPDKWKHLSRSKVLLNLHRVGVTDTEWPRVLEAMCNGAVVVSEHCSDALPLEPGEHYISASPDRVADIAGALLEDPGRLERVREQAYAFVRESMPMRTAAQLLLDRAERLSRGAARFTATLAGIRNPLSALAAPSVPSRPETSAGDLAPVLKRLAVDLLQVQRGQQRLQLQLAGGGDPDAVELVHATPAFEKARPRVSVVMPLHNHEHEVANALLPVTQSEFDDVEVLVLDDASTDSSVATVEEFLKAHSTAPGALFRTPTNHGPSWTRNRLIERARGSLLLFLDSDNAIYPTTIGRLVEALDANPDAAMAYPIVAIHDRGEPESLISHMAWRPEQFVGGQNYIDMLSMARRDVVQELGGFSEDVRLQGLEDYDLWCRMADRGLFGISVPELLGWYRRSGHSVLSLTDIDRTVAWSLIHRRAPRLFGGKGA